VKLLRKQRVGARICRQYDRPQTPFDRLLASGVGDPAALRALQGLRARLDPFALAAAIDRKLQRIYRLANRRHTTLPPPAAPCRQRALHPTPPSLEQRLALPHPPAPSQPR